MNPGLGIDFGKVIVNSVDTNGPEDTAFLQGSLEEALRVPPSAGAFEAIKTLVAEFGADRTYIVSRAGPRVQERTRRWLEHHNFYARTGFSRENVRFCRERREKADHCLELGLTHFIDDRSDVLQHLTGLVPHLYLFGAQKPGRQIPPWCEHARNWDKARKLIRSR